MEEIKTLQLSEDLINKIGAIVEVIQTEGYTELTLDYLNSCKESYIHSKELVKSMREQTPDEKSLTECFLDETNKDLEILKQFLFDV